LRTFAFGSVGWLRRAAAKLNALVHVACAFAAPLAEVGTSTPKRVSRKRSIEVWSNVSEQGSRRG